MGDKELTFCFCDELYAPYFKMCVALINYQIGILPLQKEDRIIKQNYYKWMTDKYQRAKAKRKANVQAQYETKCARRKLVSSLLDNNKENFDIPKLVNDNTSNPDCED